MSYIIAFVSFGSKNSYPVNCYRTDIKVRDRVVVSLPAKAKFDVGRVTELSFLNWDCKNHIECLASEAKFVDRTIILPSPSKRCSGLATPLDLCKHLEKEGWNVCPPNSRQIRRCYTYFNGDEHANIYLRSNGVDLQVIPGSDNEALTSLGTLSFFLRNHHRTVRHALSYSNVNIFELTARFADTVKEAAICDVSYDEFMVPQSGTAKRAQKAKHGAYSRKESLYSILGGDGFGSMYLGDGLYLGPGDSWRDY